MGSLGGLNKIADRLTGKKGTRDVGFSMKMVQSSQLEFYDLNDVILVCY